MLEKTSFPRNRLDSFIRARSDSTWAKGSDAGSRIVINQNIVDTETGPGEKIQVDGAGDVHGPV